MPFVSVQPWKDHKSANVREDGKISNQIPCASGKETGRTERVETREERSDECWIVTSDM